MGLQVYLSESCPPMLQFRAISILTIFQKCRWQNVLLQRMCCNSCNNWKVPMGFQKNFHSHWCVSDRLDITMTRSFLSHWSHWSHVRHVHHGCGRFAWLGFPCCWSCYANGAPFQEQRVSRQLCLGSIWLLHDRIMVAGSSLFWNS